MPVQFLSPEWTKELEKRLNASDAFRAAAAAAYFRDNAARWDRIRSLHVDDGVVERVLLECLGQEPVGDLLDIGTGTGRMLELLADRVETGTGIDLSREMLAVARARLERAGLSHCSLRQGDMYQLPWPEESFDAVTIHQVLHYAEDPAQAVAEAARVLRPGGRVVIVDFAPHDLAGLRDEHAHRHLGFADAEVMRWLREAELAAEPPIHLPGVPLTVTLWAAKRPALAGTGKRARERADAEGRAGAGAPAASGRWGVGGGGAWAVWGRRERRGSPPWGWTGGHRFGSRCGAGPQPPTAARRCRGRWPRPPGSPPAASPCGRPCPGWRS